MIKNQPMFFEYNRACSSCGVSDCVSLANTTDFDTCCAIESAPLERPHHRRNAPRIISRALCLLLTIGLAPLSTPSAFASPDNSEAQEHFDRGVELYRTGDTESALIEFTRAYELSPNYRLLYNIAQAAVELQDYVKAKENFQAYLSQGGDEISRERQTSVKKELDRLETYIARIELVVDTDAPEIKIDGIEIDPSRIEANGIVVSAGRRKIEVFQQGYEPWEKVIDIAGQDELRVEVHLTSLLDATGLKTPSPRDSVKKTTLRSQNRRKIGPLFWTSASLTVAFGATASVLGVMTLRQQEIHRRALKKVPTTQVVLDDSSRKLRQLALASDIAIAATGTAAVVTIAAAVWGYKRKKQTNEPKLRAFVAPNGISVHRRF